MNDELDKTIRIRRGSGVGTDDRGRNVWTKPVETVELELVSTSMLEKLLETGDEGQLEQMRALAESEDGVLAIDPSSNRLEMLSDAEFESALKSADQERGEAAGPAAAKAARIEGTEKGETQAADAESMSLVTTQMLRQILSGEEPDESDETDEPIGKGGYNPYDRG